MRKVSVVQGAMVILLVILHPSKNHLQVKIGETEHGNAIEVSKAQLTFEWEDSL